MPAFAQHHLDARPEVGFVVPMPAEQFTVIISDHVRQAHALSNFKAQSRPTQTAAEVAELLATPGLADIELDVPSLGRVAQPADRV